MSRRPRGSADKLPQQRRKDFEMDYAYEYGKLSEREARRERMHAQDMRSFERRLKDGDDAVRFWLDVRDYEHALTALGRLIAIKGAMDEAEHENER